MSAVRSEIKLRRSLKFKYIIMFVDKPGAQELRTSQKPDDSMASIRWSSACDSNEDLEKEAVSVIRTQQAKIAKLVVKYLN